MYSFSKNQCHVGDLSKRYWSPLRAYFMRRVSSRAEAEDLTQEVFLRLLRRTDAPDIKNSEAFLFRIAVNLLRDRSRREKTKANYFVPCDKEQESIEAFSSERVVLAKEALQSLVTALNELGERTRDIFLLHRLENMKYREIAEFYGISQSAVEKHMIKALAHVALHIDKR